MGKWQEVKARIARAFTEEPEPERWVSVPLDELQPGVEAPEYYEPQPGEDPTIDPDRSPRYYSDGTITDPEGKVLAFGMSLEILTRRADREIGA